MISVQKTFHAESGAQTQARQEMPFCNEKMLEVKHTELLDSLLLQSCKKPQIGRYYVRFMILYFL